MKPYPIPQKWRTLVEAKISEWFTNGWIEECDETAEWNSPLHAAPKISGGHRIPDEIRLCMDMRRVNDETEDESTEIPTIATMWNELSNSSIFSEIDLAQAYHQLSVEASCRDTLALTAPGGKRLRWTVMPFGAKGAVRHFQRQILRVIKDCRSFSVASLDNIRHQLRNMHIM